jgi:hypothetical protein
MITDTIQILCEIEKMKIVILKIFEKDKNYPPHSPLCKARLATGQGRC